MINEKDVKRYCCDDISKIHGYNEAIADKENMWHCHHGLGLVYTKEELIKRGLYYKQPAEMLMFCTKNEHRKLHTIAFPKNVKPTLGMKGWRLGKPKSEEQRKKLSKVMKNHTVLSKPVIQTTLSGDVIKKFLSLREIERELGYDHSSVSKCCLGKIKTAYGYVWRFVD